ncbi:asparagine synthase-related protein [Bacillus alkalicellulosilyticus]|uniref:asparagine synthase-related protein n=1 Tax=Alkalihalobacterium alkalicellulosilyticum TaxID=1912214 RepID=UPI0009985E37|nr:asparagine synthase-related protein [Bacillus alkalicellulosilyticus]
MSAIAGIYNLNQTPIPTGYSELMMDSLAQFPHNKLSIWNYKNVFLGCLHQWITPESITEKLPYFDKERNVAITADAIIDNRDDLFSSLQVDKAYQKVITDSELILRAYYKWGDDCPEYLIGDFAFMIWDERKHKLFGARDFSGTRTLYYFLKENTLAFCTTIEPLLALPLIKKSINEEWLAEYLAISSVVDTVDTSITPYKNIAQIPPSHSITLEEGKVRIKRYNYFNFEMQLNYKTNEEYVEAFHEVFEKAVKSRLRTFQKVGSHLSGGLDSGAVVGFAAQALSEENKPLNTFSYIPYEDFTDFTPKNQLADERPFIKSTVEYIGGIQDYYLNFQEKDPYSEINDFLGILEMPYKYFENSFWVKGMFEKAQDEGVGVLLSGGRGNFTISWGHALTHYATLLKKLRWVRLYQELNQYSLNAGGPRLRRVPYIAKLAFPFIGKTMGSSHSSTFPKLINPEFANSSGVFQKLRKYGIDETGWFSSNNMHKLRKNHFDEVYHWNATNTLSTKLSLKYSVLNRDPTNDLRVVKFCLSLPDEQCVQNGLDRAFIRRATKGMLPDKVRLNQRVRGVQGTDWLHRMALVWSNFINEIQQISNDQRIYKYIDKNAIEGALAKVNDGPKPEYAICPDYRLLMRFVIVYRYLNRML